MALISLAELFDVVIMSVFIGIIFSTYFSKFNIFKKNTYSYSPYYKKRFNWSDFLFSIYVVAPAIFLHELGHKFMAISFGYAATFHSPISIQHMLNPFLLFTDFYALLMVIAVVSSFMGASFLFFVPAYVSFSAAATPIQSTLIAFSGPFVNLVLWLGAAWFIKSKKLSHKQMILAFLISKINMFLFIFNMLPIPGFDGFKVLVGLFQTLF